MRTIQERGAVSIAGLPVPAWDVLIHDLARSASLVVIVPAHETSARFAGLASLVPDALLLDAEHRLYRSAGLVVTTEEDLARPVRPASSLELARGDGLDMEILIERLALSGYTREDIVEDELEYARRGGILDLFPPDAEPLRLEFAGETLTSIRTFNPQTQRSVLERPVVTITLAEPTAERPLAEMLAPGTVIVGASLPNFRCVQPVSGPADFEFRFTPVRCYYGDLAALRSEIANAPTRFRFFLADAATASQLSSVLGEIEIIPLAARTGFTDEDRHLTYLAENDVFGTVKKKAPRFKGLFVDDLKGLKEGDLVVHSDHGIGRYDGLESVSFQGRSVECLRIEYAGNDRLYVPVEGMNRLERYVGAENSVPKLSRIGGTAWLNSRRKAKKATERLALDLLRLYAQRTAAPGHAFAPDTAEMCELEAAFPYAETPDQARAILDVKRDMELPRPQDRLVCGDVGYGKTEIALRAAFKAALDGRQTMLLCPTTLLAFQHYRTFSARLARFPVRVALVSRFTREATPEILEQIASGTVDIAIGTHRLLQPDVVFKRLGLMIIDEEQRFGVRQKDKMKQHLPGIDVIQLSATPIPRSLYLAMTGIRDISTIQTPPPGRRDIVTRIMHFDAAEIQRIIEFECGRGGQVFYVHNRIQTLGTVRQTLMKIVPGRRICMLHGQVPSQTSERRMLEFVDGKYDILLSTAIVESGLDLPRVNTIIVDQAHCFGLADLHQLRGRVGRTATQAYAYFIVPEHALGDEAKRRLSALLSYTSLGSGFRLALRDMEIRGVGDILGREQSGFVNAIGYHHYVKMVAEAVADLRGTQAVTEPVLSLHSKAFLPPDYVASAYERVALYKRLMEVQSEQELSTLREEIVDRFGRYPPAVERLFIIASVRLRALELGAAEVVERDARYRFYRNGKMIEERSVQ